MTAGRNGRDILPVYFSKSGKCHRVKITVNKIILKLDVMGEEERKRKFLAISRKRVNILDHLIWKFIVCYFNKFLFNVYYFCFLFSCRWLVIFVESNLSGMLIWIITEIQSITAVIMRKFAKNVVNWSISLALTKATWKHTFFGVNIEQVPKQLNKKKV